MTHLGLGMANHLGLPAPHGCMCARLECPPTQPPVSARFTECKIDMPYEFVKTWTTATERDADRRSGKPHERTPRAGGRDRASRGAQEYGPLRQWATQESVCRVEPVTLRERHSAFMSLKDVHIRLPVPRKLGPGPSACIHTTNPAFRPRRAGRLLGAVSSSDENRQPARGANARPLIWCLSTLSIWSYACPARLQRHCSCRLVCRTLVATVAR